MAVNKNANVTIIPARQRVGNRKKDEERPKLRVAAYCRVSTDSDEQATSYEAQIEHYTAYIQKNPNGSWLAYLRMMVCPALTPENVSNLIF